MPLPLLSTPAVNFVIPYRTCVTIGERRGFPRAGTNGCEEEERGEAQGG